MSLSRKEGRNAPATAPLSRFLPQVPPDVSHVANADVRAMLASVAFKLLPNGVLPPEAIQALNGKQVKPLPRFAPIPVAITEALPLVRKPKRPQWDPARFAGFVLWQMSYVNDRLVTAASWFPTLKEAQAEEIQLLQQGEYVRKTSIRQASEPTPFGTRNKVSYKPLTRLGRLPRMEFDRLVEIYQKAGKRGAA